MSSNIIVLSRIKCAIQNRVFVRNW